MSALRVHAVSPETVKRFTSPPKATNEIEARLDVIEKNNRNISRALDEMSYMRRQLKHFLASREGRACKWPTNNISEIEQIVRFVSQRTGVPFQAIIERKGRGDKISDARKIAMWVAYQFRPYVLRDIAIAFKRKNHVTVWQAVRSLELDQMERAQQILNDYQKHQHAKAEIASRDGAGGESPQLAKGVQRSVSGVDRNGTH